MKRPSKIRVGVILGPHGVLGQVKLRSLTEEPDSLFAYAPLTDETGARVFEIKRRGEGKDHFIVSIKGVKDRAQAEALKGTALFVDRALLPQEAEGEYYLADLVGLEARDEAGKGVGFVEEVHDYGAGVFLEIKPKGGKSFMLPFKDAFAPVVDVAGGTIQIVVPDGWLSEEKEEKKTKNKKKMGPPPSRG